jgi:UDP-N-acetylglucosamine 1-carboxyvinyltransferase
MCLAEGTSTVEETLYEKRTGHVRQLVRMGAKIEEKGRLVIVDGVDKLRGAHVEASDLRAGAALVLAGLAAQGETVVSNIHFVDRGYQHLVENLTSLGATIERLPDPKAVL